jgi:predicted glutamine amidotransferase
MCGIFAWSAKTKDKWTPLAKFKFSILGMEMDARGGDGCGIAWDGYIRKSEAIKKFDDFWRTENNVPSKLEFPSIMGHDRKASVGGKTYDNTQPIFFEGTKDDPICSILSHNGTLYNHKELLRKYNAQKGYESQIDTMSDSQILTLLIEKVGWKILNEYVGTASIIYMHAEEPGAMYIYHGHSPNVKDGKIESEERPLYCAEEGSQIWFCSTQNALEKIVADKKLITEVPCNIVFKIVGTDIREIYKVDRSKAHQYEYGETKRWYACNNSPNTYNKKSYNNNLVEVDTELWTEEDSPYTNGYSGSHYWDEDGNMRIIKKNKDTRSLLPKVVPLLMDLKTDKILGPYKSVYWNGGLWMDNEDNLLHGQVAIFANGRIGDSSLKEGYTFYFWEGNLMKGRDEYVEAYRLRAIDPKRQDFGIYLQVSKSSFAMPYIIPSKYNGDPRLIFSPDKGVQYQGIITPAFSTKKIQFSDGKPVWIVENNGWTGIEEISKFSDPFPNELADILEKINNPTQAEDIDPEKVEYECPSCMGSGFIQACTCPDCQGECYVSFKTIEEMSKDKKFLMDRMNVLAEEAQLSNMVHEIVDYGVEVLEEPEQMEHSVHVLNQFKQIKEILEDGRYNSDVQR